VGEIALPCSKDITIGSEENANKALEVMNRTGNSRLLVVNGDELEGIISIKDMLSLLSLKMELNDLEKSK
jgi:Mg2+/Co2+ transporter CorC